MCALGPMAEGTLEIKGTNRLNDALEKTNIVNRRKSESNILVDVWPVPKSDSAGPPTLTPTLMWAGSEPELPT